MRSYASCFMSMLELRSGGEPMAMGRVLFGSAPGGCCIDAPMSMRGLAPARFRIAPPSPWQPNQYRPGGCNTEAAIS